MGSLARINWHRRRVLVGLVTAPFAGTAQAALEHVSFKVPDGACDCHHHLYDTRWAYAPTAVLKPPPATAADYRRYQARIGTSRSIIQLVGDARCEDISLRVSGPDQGLIVRIFRETLEEVTTRSASEADSDRSSSTTALETFISEARLAIAFSFGDRLSQLGRREANAR